MNTKHLMLARLTIASAMLLAVAAWTIHVNHEQQKELNRRGQWIDSIKQWQAEVNQDIQLRTDDRIYRSEIVELLRLNPQLQRPTSLNDSDENQTQAGQASPQEGTAETD